MNVNFLRSIIVARWQFGLLVRALLIPSLNKFLLRFLQPQRSHKPVSVAVDVDEGHSVVWVLRLSCLLRSGILCVSLLVLARLAHGFCFSFGLWLRLELF